MPKWLLWTLTASFLAAAFGVMSATAWLKQPLRAGEDVLAHIEALDRATDLPSPDWERAEELRLGLASAWEPVRMRIQFVAEKDDVVRFGRTVDELKGAIYARDLSMTKRHIESLRSVWISMR